MSVTDLLIRGPACRAPSSLTMRSGGHRGRLPPELGWRYVELQMTATMSAIAKMSVTD